MEKIKVLFVDDEEIFRTLFIKMIKQILKDREFEFFEASDGEEALGLIKSGIKPSIMIVDYAMPRINGIELLKRIDSDHPDLYNVPRLMVSGYDREDVKSETERLRFGFFLKGVHIKSLCEQIGEYMAARLGFSYQ